MPNGWGHENSSIKGQKQKSRLKKTVIKKRIMEAAARNIIAQKRDKEKFEEVPQIRPKAVIFTHIKFPSRNNNTHQIISFDGIAQMNLLNKHLPYFKEILRCDNIGLVYVYVDTGTQMLLESLEPYLEDHPDGVHIKFELDELALEQKTRDVLKMAVDSALLELKKENLPQFDPSKCPEFQFIGLPHLLSLFSCLLKFNTDLVRNLAGRKMGLPGSRPQYHFSYDSPKFVETIIRLVRGADAILTQSPIFRIDADVEANKPALDLLIDEALNLRASPFTYHVFSGGYGNLKGTPDPLNDFAVRTHFLPDVDKGGLLTGKGEMFLFDLGDIGATQIPGHTRPYQQVISGAGMFLSRPAIDVLPPFMNFYNLTTWVDDHLKRRLHEGIGHALNPVEHISEAKFKQNRRIEESPWTKEYFERVLHGCLFHTLIVGQDGSEGSLSRKVQDIITYHLNIIPINTITGQTPRQEFKNIIILSAFNVLTLWGNANSRYGCKMLEDWAKDLLPDIILQPGNQYDVKPGTEIEKIIDSTVEDALAYLELLIKWGDYLAAIKTLSPAGSHWLYKNVK